MCLLQSPQATLHHVSLFPLNSAYSDLWRTLWANALLLGAQNLWTIAVMKNLRSVTSQDLTEKPVGFLIGDARTVSPKYVYLQLQCPQRTTRGNATTFVIFFQPWNSPAFDHWSLHRPCCCCMSSQLGCWELESLFCGITVYWQCCSPRDWIESSKNKLASYPSIQWQQCSPCKGTTTPLDEVVWLFESKGQFPAGCLFDFHDQFHRYKCNLEANLLWEQENWKNYQQKHDGFCLPRVEWDWGQHGVLPVVLVWDYHCVVFPGRPSNHKQSCSTHSYTLIPLFTGFNGIYCFR